MRPVRVLLVDEQQTFAEALSVGLTASEDIHVVGVETDPRAVPEAVRMLRPDVVTTDVVDVASDAIEMIRCVRSRRPDVSFVVVASTADPATAIRAIWAGATGWVPKDAGAAVLIQVLHQVAAGDAYVPPHLLGAVVRRIATSGIPEPLDETPLGSLTVRETEVLRCMVAGLNRAATASQLRLSPNTVRTHTQHILAKLNVHTSLEAVSVALGAGLRPTD